MDWDTLMDCQGAQQEPEGRPRGPGTGVRARGGPQLAILLVPWSSWPSSWLLLCSLAIHQAIPIPQAILMLKPA